MSRPFCCGLVVYAGEETKLAKNSVPARSKQSNVVHFINKCIVLVFICLIALCTASAVINRFQSVEDSGAWYLGLDGQGRKDNTLEVWVTFLILYNSLVPISVRRSAARTLDAMAAASLPPYRGPVHLRLTRSGGTSAQLDVAVELVKWWQAELCAGAAGPPTPD